MAGDPTEQLKPKYERNGWPAQKRPDIQPVGGWSIELMASMTRPRTHVVSPDGKHLAFFWDQADASDLYIMSTEGGWPDRLTFDRDPVGYWEDTPPAWSPDEQWLAYTNQGHVWVISSHGGKPVRVTAFTDGAGSPRWMPDSKGLLVVVSIHDHDRIVLTDREGGWPRSVSDGPGHDWDPQPSPDGSQVVYTHRNWDDFNRTDIKLADLASGDIRALTDVPARHHKLPRWSPDGGTISYLSERPGFTQLYLYDLASGQETQLTDLGHNIAEYEWSPDGSRILATINRAGAYDLALVDVSSGAISYLVEGLGYHNSPHWLSGGDSITFEYEDALTPPDIYRMSLSGDRQQLTFTKPPALEHEAMVIPEAVSYASFDGLEIPSFLYRPANPNGAAILYPHGGPTSAYVREWDVVAQYFAAKGYTWLAINFRGSTGYGMDFERANHGVWGIDDTKDCLAGADYLASLDWVDPTRIGIFGASYGSYMATCALAYDDQYRFALGVAKYGDCNILSSWAQGDQLGREDLERMMGHPTANQAGYRAGSPVWRADAIQKPMFIAHGLDDDRVHPLQSEELVEALKRHDKVFEYVTYAREGHGLKRRANKIDFYARLERFLDWYLL